MGRLDEAKRFVLGLSAGVMCSSYELHDKPSSWQDGYAEGRRVAREALAEYLASRGYAPLGDLTIEQVLE